MRTPNPEGIRRSCQRFEETNSSIDGLRELRQRDADREVQARLRAPQVDLRLDVAAAGGEIAEHQELIGGLACDVQVRAGERDSRRMMQVRLWTHDGAGLHAEGGVEDIDLGVYHLGRR